MNDWEKHAECLGVDPELFFPERGQSPEEALKVCARCIVRPACKAYALDHHEVHGVWGGTTGAERVRIWRQRRRVERGAA